MILPQSESPLAMEEKELNERLRDLMFSIKEDAVEEAMQMSDELLPWGPYHPSFIQTFIGKSLFSKFKKIKKSQSQKSSQKNQISKFQKVKKSPFAQIRLFLLFFFDLF